MDKEQFWQVIDTSRQEAGTWKDMYNPLRDNLAQLPPLDVLNWHLILDEYMERAFKPKLFAAADVIMNGTCFEKDFDNFIAALIVQGKKAYLDALADPGTLAKVEAIQAAGREVIAAGDASPERRRNPFSFETLQDVAPEAYESKPDTDISDFYLALEEYELSEPEKAELAEEILYAHDIEIDPVSSGASYLERITALRKTFPEIYGLFNDVAAPAIQNYDFLHSVRLGGGDVIFAENQATAQPYLVCDHTWNNPLGADEFKNAVVGDDFVGMMRIFSDRVAERVTALEQERAVRGIPFETLTAADCVPDGLASDLEGKVCVLKPEKLAPEFRTIDYQLVLVTGGFGSVPNARGRKVFCRDLYTGKQEGFNRDAIAGVLPPKRLPDWAREKLAVLQKPAERESVVDKLREGKNTPPRNPKPMSHKKDGLER